MGRIHETAVVHAHDEDTRPCSPTEIPVERPDGSIGWVAAHREPGQTPAQQADRAAAIAEAIEQVRSEP